MERRTLIKGAVWSVPVVALATATPAAAASAPACANQGETYTYDPRSYAVGSSMGIDTNIAHIEVVVGVGVTVTFLRDYRNATALKIDHVEVIKQTAAWAGDVWTWPLPECYDPSMIQVDGNNTHYYGGGRFA